MKEKVTASLVAQLVKNTLAMQEIWVWFLSWKGLLDKKMATHSSILAFEISWIEEFGKLQSMGLQRVVHNLVTKQQQQIKEQIIFKFLIEIDGHYQFSTFISVG